MGMISKLSSSSNVSTTLTIKGVKLGEHSLTFCSYLFISVFSNASNVHLICSLEKGSIIWMGFTRRNLLFDMLFDGTRNKHDRDVL
jgi:hypothetical protein